MNIAKSTDQRVRDRFAVTVALLLAVEAAIAQVGTLDPSFGAGGIATPFADTILYVRSMALQTDGRIVIGGTGNASFFVVRLMPDGRPDDTFGTGGMVTTQVNAGDEGWDVKLTPDGRIVVSGESSHSFAAVRYHPNGSLDTTFGSEGIAFTRLSGGQDAARASALQSDGKLILGGSASGSFALVRYSTDGSLDSTFGDGGKVLTAMPTGSGMIRGLQIQRDKQIVVAGTGDGHVLLARYQPNGALDTAFGDQGVVAMKFDPNGGALDLKLQEDNQIIVTGYIGNKLALLRLDTDGALDTEFSSTLDLGIYSAEGHELAIQTDGKVLVSGEYNSGAFIARYDKLGALDPSFGADGLASMESAGSDSATAVAVQKDGNILVAGRRANHAFVVRLIGDSPSSPDPPDPPDPPPPLALAFDAAGILPDGVFSFTLKGTPGSQCVIEASSDLGLARWTPVLTNAVPPDGVIQFADSLAGSKPLQFYRAFLR